MPYYCEMVSANLKSRPNPSNLLDQLREPGGFLANHHVSIALTIEEVQVSGRGNIWNALSLHYNFSCLDS